MSPWESGQRCTVYDQPGGGLIKDLLGPERNDLQQGSRAIKLALRLLVRF